MFWNLYFYLYQKRHGFALLLLTWASESLLQVDPIRFNKKDSVADFAMKEACISGLVRTLLIIFLNFHQFNNHCKMYWTYYIDDIYNKSKIDVNTNKELMYVMSFLE